MLHRVHDHAGEVEDQLGARTFAIIEQYLCGDLEAVLALVGEDDAELLPIVIEILTGALLRLVSMDERARQVDARLDERVSGWREAVKRRHLRDLGACHRGW
jgi:hypothetical protein